MNEWAKRADPQEMKVFVDKVYEVFTAAGVSDLNEFTGNKLALLQNAWNVMDNMSDEERQRVKAVLSSFIGIVKDQIKEKVGFGKD